MCNKKLLALSLVVALSFSACGKKADTTPETTPIPTEAPVVEETPIAEETPDVEEDVETSGDSEVETGAVASNETLDAIHDKVLELIGEEYVANMAYPSDAIAETFGVSADWYDAAIAEGPMMMTHVDKFLAFHATEGNLENIQNALNAYRDTIIADTMQYPMNLVKIQGCVVETVGDYVFLVMVGFIDEMAYEEEGQMIDAYTAINNSVIDAAKEVIGQ